MTHSMKPPAETENGIVEADQGCEPVMADYPTFSRTFICVNSLALLFWFSLAQPRQLSLPLFALGLLYFGPIGWLLLPVVIALAFLFAVGIFFLGLYVPVVMSFDYGTLDRRMLLVWTTATSVFAFWLLSIQIPPKAGALQWIAATGLAMQFSLIPGLVHAVADYRKERQQHAR
jgi:hypothetical protein